MLFPLGYDCSIINLNIQIDVKRETTPFEWFKVKELQSIVNVIQRLLDNEPIEKIIYNHLKYIYIGNDRIKSLHYTFPDFIEIFKRRWDRFLNTIKDSSEVWFVRYNNKPHIKTTQTEIHSFIKVIRNINPNCVINLLLIDAVLNKELFQPFEINEENVNFKQDLFTIEDIHKGKSFMIDNEVCYDKYKNMLIEMNYNFDNPS
jgi:hypothetical protein